MRAAILILLLAGCGSPAPTYPPRADCPPLPTLAKGANRYEARIYVHTIIELYGQCAGSKP